MAEVGCDLSGHHAKTFEELADASFDVVVSLSPESERRAVEMARRRAADIEYWPIPDPTLAEGSRAAKLDVYRSVRDALAAKIAARFGR
jgi:protein-tyrosine-phosphatase